MAMFLSTYEKQIDKKGRVSVPAAFRSVLHQGHADRIVIYPSFVNPCIEACGMDRIEQLHQRIEALDPFSEARDAFATAILGSAIELGFDKEGRVIFPPELLQKMKIGERAVFVGKGSTFEVWSPEPFETHQQQVQAFAKEHRGQLRAPWANGGEA